LWKSKDIYNLPLDNKQIIAAARIGAIALTPDRAKKHPPMGIGGRLRLG
jgi:hypothetical protein